MNDIEKAIEYFEVGKNCIPKNETKEYRTLFIEVANTAIQALQEKQERDKGCEYCNKTIYKYAYEPYISEQECFESMDNNYCPMCGRKLGKNNE